MENTSEISLSCFDVDTNTLRVLQPISNDICLIFRWVFYSIITEMTNIFGIVSNIINIICFVKLGLKDTINISLLGLAISDLGCLITLTWTGICYNPVFTELDLPFDPVEIQYLTAGGPHIIFARVTSCITVFITVERCLCVTMPLKVKLIFTTKRVKIIMLLIYIVVFGIFLPVFHYTHFGVKFSQTRNKTIIGAIVFKDRQLLYDSISAIGGVFLEIAAFVATVLCTVILVVKLRSKTQWREMTIAPEKVDSTTIRDQKVSKMVAAISVFFIVCFTPTCLALIAIAIEPGISIEGQYKNIFIIIFSVCFALESVNSASNILVYYHMSSKYKAVFRQLILRRP